MKKTIPIRYSSKPIKSERPHTVAMGLLRTTVRKIAPTAKRVGKKLGSGAFGIVYAHPTNPRKAIKVCWRSPRYIRYLQWCIEHRTNPHVPRIHSIHVIRNPLVLEDTGRFDDPRPGEYAVIVMERLQPEGSVSTSELRAQIGAVCYHRHGNPARTMPQAVREIGQAIKEMFSDDPNTHLDLHGGNALGRKDGTPVLTDPIAG